MNKTKIIKEVKSIIKALIVVVSFKTFFFSNWHIPSESMYPTLLVGDKLIINKYHYGYSRYSILFGIFPFKGRVLDFNKPKKGDVLVFAYPQKTTTLFIKRVVGIEDDVIKFGFDGKIHSINNEKIEYLFKNKVIFEDQEYNLYQETMGGIKHDVYIKTKYDNSHFSEIITEYKVPKGKIFASGDNRHMSHDSRFSDVGYIDIQNIIGRASLKYFSSGSSIFNPIEFFKQIRWNRIFKKIT
jgi:signal peptidase I